MLRTLIHLFILLLFYGEFAAGKKDCSKFPGAPPPTTLSTLRKTVFCKYDASEPPPTNLTTPRVAVQIHSDRSRVQFTGTKDYASTFMYLLVMWEDSRLKWKESDFKNHSRLYVDLSDIWSPTLTTERYNPSLNGWVFCLSDPPWLTLSLHWEDKHSNCAGEVMMLVWWETNARCKPTYSKWTDKRICTVSFQLEPADIISLEGHYWLTGSDDDKHSAWRIVDLEKSQSEDLSRNVSEASSSSSKLDQNRGQATLHLHIIRNTAIMEAALYSPAIVLFLLLLSSTWIPCGQPIRIAVLSLTILLEIFLMNMANKAIPTFPGRFSDFSVLYRDMVVVSGAAFFEWYVAFLVASKKIPSTSRVQSLAATASQSTYAFLRNIFLIPSNPPKVGSGSLEGAFLSVILDRITFVILLLLFIIIMLVTAHSPIEVSLD